MSDNMDEPSQEFDDRTRCPCTGQPLENWPPKMVLYSKNWMQHLNSHQSVHWDISGNFKCRCGYERKYPPGLTRNNIEESHRREVNSALRLKYHGGSLYANG